MLQTLIANTGLDQGILMNALCAFLLPVLGYIYSFIPTSKAVLRHSVNIIFSATTAYIAYGLDFLKVIFIALVYFALIKSPLYKIKNSHLISCVILFAILIYGHIRNIMCPECFTLHDWRSPFMLLFARLTSMSFSLKDGEKKDEDLNDHQKIYKITPTEVPNLFKFLSFVMFFPGFCYGPAPEYKDTIAAIEGTEDKIPNSKIDLRRYSMRYFPSTKKAVILEDIGVMAVSLALNIVGAVAIDIYAVGTPEFVTDNSFIYRWFFFPRIIKFIYNAKYAFVWSASSLACTLAGFGHRESFYGYFRNLELGSFFAPNPAFCIASWNVFISYWLRYTVVDRVPAFKTLFSFMFSGIWHGLEPCYVITFYMGAVAVIAYRKLSNALGHYAPSKSNPWVYAFYNYITDSLIGVSFLPFICRKTAPAIQSMKNYNFVPFIALTTICIIPFGSKKRPVIVKQEKNLKQE